MNATKLHKAVRDVIKKLDTDILITCHQNISYAAVLNKRKLKGRLIVTQHCSCDYLPKKHLLIGMLLYRFADKLVVLTEFDKEIYQNYHCPSMVIQNANFKEVNEKSNFESKVILAAGRLEEVKGFDRLIDAFSRIAHKHKDWKLCICGGGSLETKLKEQANALSISEQVEFAGNVKNMEHYYRAASIFAQSSHYEGFPLVLIEAMSFGLPVISFDIAATIDMDEKCGCIIIPQGDIVLFSEKLDELICDDEYRRKMSKEALNKSENYSVSAVANEWKQLFLSLCK